MIIMFLIFGLLILASGIFIYTKFGSKLYHKDMEWIYIALNTVGIIVIAISIIAGIIVGSTLTDRFIIDEKIALHESENKVIEEEIATIAQEYKTYESTTFENLKYTNPTTIVSVFPELKSNEIVKQQVDLYISNNKEIKMLKQSKLNHKLLAWWLYFGS